MPVKREHCVGLPTRQVEVKADSPFGLTPRLVLVLSAVARRHVESKPMRRHVVLF